MKVVWTENALQRMQEIEEYIAQSSPESGKRWMDRLIARGEGLSSFPKIGRKVPELNSEKIREVLEDNYRIVYRLQEHRIDILTVFEGHHLLPELFQPSAGENADRVQENSPPPYPGKTKPPLKRPRAARKA